MDGRRALKERRLRSMTKCQYCAKKFLTVQALRAHESIHKARTISKNKLSTRVVKTKPTILQRKLVAEKPKPADVTVIKPDKVTGVEFKCPKCSLAFLHYQQALKHIQKLHCVDDKDKPVSPNSPNIIKPIQNAFCRTCNMHVNSEPHTCPTDGVEMYKCLGCSQSHYNLYYFDQHLSRMHSEGVESMFFPSESEFLSWKAHMEDMTKASYTTVKDHNEKQIYKCLQQEAVDGMKLMCPSSIITQKFTNGIQVHFYRKHFSHIVRPYTIGAKFKNYSITNFVNITNTKNTKTIDNADKTPDIDLYVQFKKLMDEIAMDAAKLNIRTLKVLLDKAYEMSLILKNYNEDDEEPEVPNNRPLLDDQITLALEEPIVKKKEDTVSKKIKLDDTTESVENTAKVRRKTVDSKKDKVVDIKTVKEDDEAPSNLVTSTPKQKPQPLIQSPTSFNDSYKNFVDVNFKTSIDKPKGKTIAILQKVAQATPKKKQVVKTKIGQFKPSLSPKKSPKPSDINLKLRDLSEMDYEIKERDNDCNILILKI